MVIHGSSENQSGCVLGETKLKGQRGLGYRT
jgi:hypothetical protein